jgi:hypothetical protein
MSRGDAGNGWEPSAMSLKRLLLVAFPTCHLLDSVAQLNKSVIWLPPAPNGRCRNLEVELMSNSPAGSCQLIERSLKGYGAQVCVTHEMPNGETLVLFTTEEEWTNGDLIVPASVHETDDLVFPIDNPTENLRSITLTMYLPIKDGVLLCGELSAFSRASRARSFAFCKCRYSYAKSCIRQTVGLSDGFL